METLFKPNGKRYEIVAGLVREAIIQSNWRAGHALPSEQELASQFKVALGTVRQAITLLAEQGWVDRVHGRGTFVRNAVSGANMLRFFRFGSDPDVIPQSVILSRKLVAMSASAAAALEMPSGSPALQLARLRKIEGRPCLLEDIILPTHRFGALLATEPGAWGDLLYPAYEALCQVHILQVVDTIRFDQLSASQGKRLQLAAGHPCVLVERVAFDRLQRPVEWRQTRANAFAFTYTTSIH